MRVQAAAASSRRKLGALVSIASAALLATSLAACDKKTGFDGIDPASGSFAGGEEVTLLGNKLPREGISVRFGDKDAQPVIVESDSKVKVQTPPGAKNTTVDVTITFDDGRTFLLPKAFRYVDSTQQRETMDKFFDRAAKKAKQ